LGNATFLEKYVDNDYDPEITLFKSGGSNLIKSWSPLVYGFYYVLSKILTFATDYSDSLCITLAFGLKSRLQTMNEYLRFQLHHNYHQHLKQRQDSKLNWPKIYRDFVNLRKISDQISKCTSPLIFVSFLVNVFAVVSYVCHVINLNLKLPRLHTPQLINSNLSL